MKVFRCKLRHTHTWNYFKAGSEQKRSKDYKKNREKELSFMEIRRSLRSNLEAPQASSDFQPSLALSSANV